MINIINTLNTLIICGTVVYCIRVVLSAVIALLNKPVPESPSITEEQLDQVYDDLKKMGKLPPDITDFMQQMLNDED